MYISDLLLELVELHLGDKGSLGPVIAADALPFFVRLQLVTLARREPTRMIHSTIVIHLCIA